MANIVVFGKAQSGKSTLLGYLYAQSNNLDMDRFEEKTKAQLGNDYEPSYLYAYIMDKSKYERTVKKGTRNMHIKKIDLDASTHITIIDTPGVEHHVRPRQRGAFFGDIGIFCLELRDVISDEFMLSPKETMSIMSILLLWSNLGHKNIIVALTKCDECDYSKADFLVASDRIHSLCGNFNLEEIKIVPISIDVFSKEGFNIVNKTPKFEWYDGATLKQTLTSEIASIDNSPNSSLLFCIHNQIDKPSSKAGKVWTIKIIQGELSIGDSIVISPVLTKNREFTSLSCKVKTLRSDLHEKDGKEVIETAVSGDIVGIDLKHIYSNGEKIDKKSFDTIYTTCGFSANSKYVTSGLFSFLVELQYSDVFVPKRQFSLIWFGRGISFSIEKVTHDDTGEKLIVVARICNRKLTLPLYDDGKYYSTKLIIKDGNERLSNPYYEGILLDILQE